MLEGILELNGARRKLLRLPHSLREAEVRLGL